jgi:KDO2-lipid IV(A) lauroyltransferase
LRHLIELFVFFLLAFPFIVLPRGIALKVGESLGVLVYYLWGSRRKIALENIKGAVQRGALSLSQSPEETIKNNFRNMGRSLAEIVKVYGGRGDSVLRSIDVEGWENYCIAKEKGNGVIFITGHCGNWELLALSFSTKVETVYGVVRQQSNPYIDRFIVKARKKYGTRITYKEGALKKFISALREGETVGILIDQSVIPKEGILVDFLGAPAWTTKMAASLARRTSAAVIPVFMKRTEGGHVIKMLPEMKLEGDDNEDTRKVTLSVEDYIRENPSDWLWIHRRWKRTDQV